MGGGRRGQRSRPGTDSSVAPSLGSSPRPHFPPPLAPSSILCRPSILIPWVVPLPPLRVITLPHWPTRELYPPAPGSEGLLCLGWGFSWGSLGGSLQRGLRGSRETPARRSLPPAGLPSGLGTLSSPIPQP